MPNEPDKPAPAEELARLVEGVDYYIENGRWVFTEKFLRERGMCCHSGCRHCPYGKAVSGSEPSTAFFVKRD